MDITKSAVLGVCPPELHLGLETGLETVAHLWAQAYSLAIGAVVPEARKGGPGSVDQTLEMGYAP